MRRPPKSRPRPLTARECATLERLARGMTQKMIAFEFGISINTVGNIAANAYKKLGVPRRRGRGQRAPRRARVLRFTNRLRADPRPPHCSPFVLTTQGAP
ncbi:MAG: response regulator transcription factor [Thermoleophilaceae bacterium]